MATFSGTKRKNDWEAAVNVTPKKLKPSNLRPSPVTYPDSAVDAEATENAAPLSTNQGREVEPPMKSNGLNRARLIRYQLPDDTAIQDSQDTDEKKAAYHATSTDEFVEGEQWETAVRGSAGETPAPCSSTHPAVSKAEMDGVVNPNGYEGTVRKTDDAVVQLVKLCRGLRDRNDVAVLMAQICLGRKYCCVLEENDKLRGQLIAREARHRYVAGKLLESELALSAKDDQLKELKTRLVAKKALEYLEVISS
ncbi:hypothetical protein F5Y05DRAFT_246880 [Hypoxylon sp. FL0543]|nr:hypothetical protein F5Y05DRAFT_246880 [Hypoxylon sp. FL0543]